MATSIALKIAPVVNRGDNVEHENYLESASEDELDSEDEIKHEKLLKDISSLGSINKKRHLPERSEPSRKVSEFHLSAVKENEEQVELSDLIGSLSNTNENGILKKKLDGMQKYSDTLDMPLPTPESQKIQRVIAFGQAKKDVSKWGPIVKKNREAEHLSFPLQQYTPPVPSLKVLTVNFKPRTPLEEEVAAVLRGSSHVLERSNRELTADEEKALQAMDLEEAKERRKELQKFRVLQSYYEAKCRRIKRIKSKNYRRVRRRAEMRAGAKMIAEGEGPGIDEEDDKVLEKAERMRIQERATLKHRNMSKWSRYLMNKAKDSSQAKKLLQEELRFSRKLTEKRKPSPSQVESDEEITETPAGATEEREGGQDNVADEYGDLLTSKDNPWRLETAGSRPQPEAAASSGVEHDPTARLRRLKEVKSEVANDNKDDDSEDDSEEMQSEDEFEVEMIKPTEKGRKPSSKEDSAVVKKRKSDINSRNAGEKAKKRKKVKKIDKISRFAKESVEDDVGGGQSPDDEEVVLLKRKRNEVEKKNLRKKSKDQRNEKLVTKKNISTKGTIDKAFGKRNLDQSGNANTCYGGKVESSITERSAANDIRVDPKKIFRIEDHGNAGDEIEGDSLQQKRIDIQRAFANDDVVEEFVKNKRDAEIAHQPKDIEMTLPGWGSWAGAGIVPSEGKKKFIKKAEPAPPRKDRDLAHVIINEEKSKLLAQNQVTEVPHPYTHHVQFERSIRNPVGRHWNTDTAVEQLTKPRVSTTIGTIIDPIKATKEIKRKKDEDRKEKKQGTESSGITIHN